MVRVSSASERLAATLRETGDPTNWQSLNGLWEWEAAVDHAHGPVSHPPFGKTLNRSILVPFPVESCLSGVAPQAAADIRMSMWYRLTFLATGIAGGNFALGSRTILHFGAVDWQSSFFLNGKHVANHSGGYDSIDIDITDALVNDLVTLNELLIYVYDPSNLGDQPNGKQNIMSSFYPGGGQYTASSGIWQTVWLEVVPPVHIRSFSLNQNSVDTITMSAHVSDAPSTVNNISNAVLFNVYERGSAIPVATGTAAVGAAISLKIPSPRVWGPSDPYLYDFTASLLDGANDTTTSATDISGANDTASAIIDITVGYFGLRSFRLGHQKGHNTTRPLLNGRFTFLAGWLDQSWWPDGQYTAPTDEALAFDLQAVSMFGLNTIRLHMKVNPNLIRTRT